MKKILFFIGSNHDSSDSKFIVDTIVSDMKYTQLDYEYEVLHLKEYEISMCTGCRKCFYNGECIQNKADDVHEILKKIKNADIVVFFCPVYFANVPGYMKNFFDRLSCYSHTMKFAGTLGFIIITTSVSGGEYVSEYFQRILPLLGIKLLGHYVFDYLKQCGDISNLSKSIIMKLYLNYGLSNQRLEEIFQYNKEKYRKERKNGDVFYEVTFWKQKWIKQIKSFQKFASLHKEK